jgi:hydrophobic/amphiphilic exporter-1 (mainly G- bacteria), HAE1 family
MWHLTRLALHNRLVTLGIVIVLTGLSIWALLGLQQELIPDIEFPYITVITVYPQAPADQVASEVSTPIEKMIWERWEGKGLKHVTSTSAESISLVFAEFEYGTGMGPVTEALNQGIGEVELPAAVRGATQVVPDLEENPRVIPINLTSMMPLVTFSLSGDGTPEQLKAMADADIVPALSEIKGVLSVETLGGQNDQVIVTPDPAKMNQYGLSMAQIIGALPPEYHSLVEVSGTLVGTDNVALGDIATVHLGPTSAITRTNGETSVTINVVKTDESNTVKVANAVVHRANEIDQDLGNGLKLTVVTDQSDFIESSIGSLVNKALIGGALAVVVVFLFLMAVRASLVTAISIPISMLLGFLAMRLSGITINILTLSAMSIAVGRLIDDSIVIVEVIYRRLQKGEGFREAAIGGAKEVATPITAATLATVVIFLPLAFVGGIVGEMFIPFALTVTFAMLASLLVALMVVPTLSNFLVGGKARIKDSESWYEKAYAKVLRWALRQRAVTLAIAAVLFLGSLGLLNVIGTSFMSGMSEESLTVDIQMPPGTDIGATSDMAAQVEALLATNEQVKTYYTTVGTSTSLMGAMSAASGGGSNTAQITVYPNSDVDKLAESLRTECASIPGGEGIVVSSAAGAEMGFSGVDVSIQGDDPDAIAKVANELHAALDGVDGVANLTSELTTVVPKLDIQADQAKMAALGLSAEQSQQMTQEYYLLMYGGSLPGVEANIDGSSYSLHMNGVAAGLAGVQQAGTLRIGWPSVALVDVANVALVQVPTHISHTDLKLSGAISGAITKKDVGAVNKAVQEKINNLSPHEGVEVKVGGVAEEMSSTFARMGIAIIVAIFISFLVVAIVLRSVLNPLIIMVSLPLATIGAFLGLLIGGYTLGVSGMMGMLMLVGIVLTNAIVLIAVVEQLRKSGMSTHDALVQGGQTRLRPILMTALTTIFAMVPLALGVESGTVIAGELAVVVIGGLFSSTLLTLLVIPVLYSLTDRFRRKRSPSDKPPTVAAA